MAPPDPVEASMSSSEIGQEQEKPSIQGFCGRVLNLVTAVATTPLYTLLAAFTLIYGLAAWFMIKAGNEDGPMTPFIYVEQAMVTSGVFFFGFIIFRPLYIIVTRWPARPLKAIAEDFRGTVFSLKRLIQALPILVLFPIFFSIFTCFKYNIPLMVPFHFDPLFAEIDKAMHGGRHPWQLLQPVLGSLAVTFVIAAAYKMWFFVKFCALYWQAFSTSLPVVRAQFFLATFLTWVINGSLFALIFSSAGPCYYGLLLPDAPDPYAGLMDYLNAAHAEKPMWTKPMQDFLWEKYTDRDMDAFSGISAFPSIHVANALLFLLAASYYGRLVTAFFATFFVMTVIGSVHLGWHYAVDGYFSVLTTFLIWIWSGRLVRKFRLHEPRRSSMIVTAQ